MGADAIAHSLICYGRQCYDFRHEQSCSPPEPSPTGDQRTYSVKVATCGEKREVLSQSRTSRESGPRFANLFHIPKSYSVKHGREGKKGPMSAIWFAATAMKSL